MKFAIDGSMPNVIKSVLQNMIAWKTSNGCAHFAVKLIRLTMNIRPKTKFL